MSRIVFGIILFALGMITLASSVNASSFATGEQYIDHIKSEPGCVTRQCHANFLSAPMYPHQPSASGACDACHKAGAYPNAFGITSDQEALCSLCHESLDREIRSSRYVHGPIKNGDCASCHDPHGSEERFMLREPYSTLCSSCHNLSRLFAGDFVHKPVKEGNCGLCHDAHASNYKARVTDAGANLCVICHENMVMGMTLDYVHEPLLTSGCSGCHDPHSGDNRLRLKASAGEICFTCHGDKKNEVSQYARKHAPAVNGKCTSCHSPHFSENRHLLLDKTDLLCYTCHQEGREWQKRKYLHGPVVHGNCSVCHNPHGSDHAFILRLSFPHKFYTSYEKGKYDLCFLCHKEALISEEKTETATNFRNGETNLHRLHVKQKRGRNCRACHDVHASDQEGRIRDEFPYGNSSIPMIYVKTGTGGTCIPGCHSERAYDRIHIVDNRALQEERTMERRMRLKMKKKKKMMMR